MKKRPLVIIAATACFALLAAPAIAKPGNGKGNGNGNGKGNSSNGKGKSSSVEHPGKSKDKSGKPDKAGKDHSDKDHKEHKDHKGGPKFDKFNDKEHLDLRNFFAPDNRKNLPPGLRKNLERGKPLPPGWQKKVAAGQVINGDWLKLMSPISYDDLPGIRRSPGTRMYYHDNRLIRVNEETRVIMDVINLLAR